jgi:hypothetical protein
LGLKFDEILSAMGHKRSSERRSSFFVAEGPPLPMNSLGERRRRVLGKSGIDLG